MRIAKNQVSSLVLRQWRKQSFETRAKDLKKSSRVFDTVCTWNYIFSACVLVCVKNSYAWHSPLGFLDTLNMYHFISCLGHISADFVEAPSIDGSVPVLLPVFLVLYWKSSVTTP